MVVKGLSVCHRRNVGSVRPSCGSSSGCATLQRKLDVLIIIFPLKQHFRQTKPRLYAAKEVISKVV